VLVVLVVVAAAALLVLLGAGVQRLVSWGGSRRVTGSAGGPAARVSPTPVSPGPRSIATNVQENKVADSGTLLGVQGGDLIVHNENPGQPQMTPAARQQTGPPESIRTQHNMAQGSGQLFAVQDGDMHLNRLPGQQPLRPGQGPADGARRP
jgi:hypothetical protein